MAVNDGFSRNIELLIMIDKYNKDSRVRMAILASSNEHGLGFRYRVWLQVMGLIETWDVIK